MPTAAKPTNRRLAARLLTLERLLAAGGYEVRYERGHFRAGACLVHERRVVVVNRYFDTEARARALETLAPSLALDRDAIADEGQRALLDELRA